MSKAIHKSNTAIFHAVGDTGGDVNGDDVEKAIANAMDKQISEGQGNNEKVAPLFLYHLGYVVYFNGQSYLYDGQFYEPFQYYHAPIFAIPGIMMGTPLLNEAICQITNLLYLVLCKTFVIR